MKKFMKRFVSDEDGAELVEWAIVIAIAAVIAIPVLTLVLNVQQKVQDADGLLQQINPQDYAGTVGGGAAGGTGSVVGGGAGSSSTPTP